MEWTSIIAMIGCGVSIATFFAGRLSVHHMQGRKTGNLEKDVEYIKKSVDRIDSRLNDHVKRLEGRMDEQSKQLVDLGNLAARAQESAKSAHKRLDEHLKREHGQNVVHSP